jgi:GGDEF domain-containing protein
VIADRGDHFLLLQPEAGRQEAEQVAKRLERAASERHGIALRFGIASFPHQEITFDKLLETAESELREVERTSRDESSEVVGSTRLAPSSPAGS